MQLRGKRLPIEGLEDSIYEAAIIPERWASVLGSISRAVGAKGGVFFGVSTVATSWVASESLQEAMEAFVSEGWALRNTRMEAGLKRGLHLTPRFITEDDYYPGEVEREAIYHQFSSPAGLGILRGRSQFFRTKTCCASALNRARNRGRSRRVVSRG